MKPLLEYLLYAGLLALGVLCGMRFAGQYLDIRFTYLELFLPCLISLWAPLLIGGEGSWLLARILRLPSGTITYTILELWCYGVALVVSYGVLNSMFVQSLLQRWSPGSGDVITSWCTFILMFIAFARVLSVIFPPFPGAIPMLLIRRAKRSRGKDTEIESHQRVDRV